MDRGKLTSAILISICFGSIHAYGVLLSPIEHWLEITRAQASAVYSVAIIAITVGVFVTGRLEAMLGIGPTLLGCGILAVGGLAMSGSSQRFGSLVVGFGALYGLANGVAYSLSLILAARSMPGREGKAIGLTIGAYGFGAVLSAQIFDLVLRVYSLPALLLGLGTVSMIISCLAGMLAGFGQSIKPQDRNNSSLPGIRARLVPLWICYCLAAFAGLMVLAHGPAIAALSGNTKPGVAAGLVSLGSIFGSYLGGACADRVSGRVNLSMPILLQFFAVVCLALASSAHGALLALGLAGVSYGAMTSAVPVEVLRISGPDWFARDYGKIVTAWGIAGVAGPVTAGYCFDLYGGYAIALSLAGGMSVISAIIAASVTSSVKRSAN